MKIVIGRLMLIMLLSASSAFSRTLDKSNDIRQNALQEDLGTQPGHDNDQTSRSDDQAYSSSKKHKAKKKNEKKKKKEDKKQDEDSISQSDN